MRAKSIFCMGTAVLAAISPTASQAQQPPHEIFTQKWSCSVFSKMEADHSYRIYNGGSFSSRFIFELTWLGNDRYGGKITTEYWSGGDHYLLEFQASGTTAVDLDGNPAVLVERMGIVRTKGRANAWPAFYQSMLALVPNGNVRAEVDVGKAGDVAYGGCTPWYG